MGFSQNVLDFGEKYDLQGHDTVPTDPAYTVQNPSAKNQPPFPVTETALAVILFIILVLLLLIYRKLSTPRLRN